ncbi:hypothetical protein N0V83_003310 [Neocucurbitaria cava]|uniref:Uncharacterized protein n=1 Tax=Neocucurbitaria cava TaxID=798079 RepID=A0A9W9CND8_9PLEO|nr:hypothetical protein N0V83_003310 [Neocucurbitaria cava]
MSLSATYLQCFNHNLPQLDASPGPKKTRANPSSPSTANAKPPLVLLCLPTTSFEKRVDQAFQANMDLRTRLQAVRLPTDFPEFALVTEQDVVEATALYILAPIYEVLHALYPSKWLRFAEQKSEKVLNQKGEEEPVRYDLIIKERGGKRKTIAVLEYKKRNMVDYDDFKAALLSYNATPTEIQTRKIAASKLKGRTFLKPNAEAYTKQVSKYAKSTECGNVALFNWDNLVLFDFNRLGQPDFDAGDQANLVWVNESGVGGPFVNGAHIRKALLGFLLKAFEDAELHPRRFFFQKKKKPKDDNAQSESGNGNTGGMVHQGDNPAHQEYGASSRDKNLTTEEESLDQSDPPTAKLGKGRVTLCAMQHDTVDENYQKFKIIIDQSSNVMDIEPVMVLRVHTTRTKIAAVIAIIDPTFKYQADNSPFYLSRDPSLMGKLSKSLLEHYLL